MKYYKTYTGDTCNPMIPETVTPNLIDIAHHLSMICRYAGGTQDFYSVAQHSVHVSQLMEMDGYDRAAQLDGLMHDASEAYLGDMLAMLKDNMPAYRKWEDDLTARINKHFGVDAIHDRTKVYDLRMREYEKAALLRGAQTGLPNGWKVWTPVEANLKFLERFYEITK